MDTIKRARLVAEITCGMWMLGWFVAIAAVPGGRAALDRLRETVRRRSNDR
jgi:hypothetical protein